MSGAPAGRWVEVEPVPYSPRLLYCRATGMRLARRYWQVGDDEAAIYASPEAARVEQRVEELRRRFPSATRPVSDPPSPLA